MEKNKYTAVVILNYNNVENTISCIDSIKKYNSALIKFIVIDNGSTRDGCVETLVNYSKEKFSSDFSFAIPGETIETPLSIYTLVLNPSNDGYARGNNIGLRLVFQDEDIDTVLIVNNDILFVEDIIPKLSWYYSNIKNCGCLSPLLLNSKGEIDHCCARKEASFSEILLRKLFMNHFADLVLEKRYILKKMKEPFPEIIEVELTSGSCLFMKKQVLALMGGLDPNTYLYYEENIINARLKQQMLHNFICSEIKCIHLGGSSTSAMPSVFLAECERKSCLYFYKKYTSINKIQFSILAFVFFIYCGILKVLNYFK